MNEQEQAQQPTPTAVIPRATYRMQFNEKFTFSQATELIGYLDLLGVSHLYASPYLKARAGSTHGYDIVDHTQLNPEIGSAQDLLRMVEALRRRGMGQILDIVPNHMGVGGDDNTWWLDVLENGQASVYADFFDIDWRPLKDELRGKVLLAMLGDHYGAVLANGDLRLTFDRARGELSVYYYEHRFPIDPQTYPSVLELQVARLDEQLGRQHDAVLEYASLISAFGKLPSRHESTLDKREERNRDKEIHKRRLMELCEREPRVAELVASNVKRINGEPGDAASFDALHQLLEQQAYRLAYWQVASHEINYRRFFDINGLAGVRVENPRVFQVTHQLAGELLAAGQLDGVRIDHPDGLYAPQQYYRNLQELALRAKGREPDQWQPSDGLPLYVAVEKILASHEYLPEEWPVQGTTGYDFANLVNGLFVMAANEREFSRLFTRVLGRSASFDDIVYERKRLIMKVALSSELTVLASMLNRISEQSRDSRDYTLQGLREALMEVVACFPVYRTYVRRGQVTTEDRRYVDWAIAHAKKRSPAADVSIFDFVRAVLLLEWPEDRYSTAFSDVVQFAMKFQQYTAPVMAKGVEDTSFYIYNRLVSLNEVGGDPKRFGVSVPAFHRINQERARRWPHTMLCTSSHDTKRSEDVRVRIDVLSELPKEWRRQVGRWNQLNKAKKVALDDGVAPSRNDEYLLYQTLLGAFPLEPLDEEGLGVFRERIRGYMLKAVREAKVHSSWINPNTAYEDGVLAFVDAVLHGLDRNPFLNDFIPFQQRTAFFGLLNGLSQTVLKLMVPGVPDIYQGCELWDFSLVDPDNRRPVDYGKRMAALDWLRRQADDDGAREEVLHACLESIQDGRVKMYAIATLLNLRRRLPELFAFGTYVPLAVSGGKSDHVVAFARQAGDEMCIVAVARWYYTLCGGEQCLPLGDPFWREERIALDGVSGAGGRWREVLSGRGVSVVESGDGGAYVELREVFARAPVAVLQRHDTAPHG